MMYMIRVGVASVLALSLMSCRGAGEINFPHEATDLPPESRVEYGRLENGLRYAVMQNATPSKTATLLMRIDTGSLNEADDERGLAHFLEHMAFNGSKNIPEGEMIPRLEKFGLAFGADTNASTGFDETIYQLELPEVSEEILNEGLFIMRETASNLLLDPEAIEKERGIILAEKRSRTSPAFHASIAQLNYYMDGTIIPDRLPIGTDETIKAVTAEQFRAFYEGYYRPEKAFIVLVGDFETDHAASKIAKYFDDWQGVGESKKPHVIKVLEPKSKGAEYYTDPEIQTSVTINVTDNPDLRVDSKQNRKDYYVEGLGNRILSRRLGKLAQTTNASFISGGASSSTAYDAIKISSVTLSTQPDQWAAALKTGEQELRRAYLYGFSQAELDEQIANSRQSLKVGVERSETRRTPNLARRILGSFSGDNVMTTPKFGLEFFESYADQITLEQVHDGFKKSWANYQNPQIYLSTSAVLENAETDILSALTDSQAVEVEPLAEETLAKFAYTDFGAPGKIASRETVEDIDFEQIVFENGIKLNLKKTPYQAGIMSIQMAYGKGDIFLPEGGEGIRWLLGNALSLGGLEAHSSDDIQTLMAGKSVGAGHSMGVRQMFMSGSTTPDDLPHQLNLMMAYYTAPGFRAEAKARYDKYISSFYPTLDSTPGGVASKEIDRLIRSGDPRFGIPAEQVLRSAELEDAKAWLAKAVSGEAIEIGIVGDIDVDQVIKEVGRTFGTVAKVKSVVPVLPSEKIKLKFPDGKVRPTVLTHAGEDTTALLRIYWPGFDGSDDMVIRRSNMLKSMFQLELNDVIREELGASYSPSAFFSSPRTYPDYGYVGVSVEVSPDDIDKAEARIHSLAQSFAAGDVDQDLFDRAIRPIQESIEETLESNGYWMGIIGRSQSDPEAMARHRRRYDAYQNMTIEDVKGIAKSVFARENAVSYHIVPGP